MRGLAIIALAVLATSMIVEDATAVDSSEQKDLTQLLRANQVHFEKHKDTSQRGIAHSCHQAYSGERDWSKCPPVLLDEQLDEQLGEADHLEDDEEVVDHSRHSRPFTRKAFKMKTYASRCAYYKETDKCKFRHIKRRCSQTCAGKGKDRMPARKFSAPETRRKVYKTRCAFFKEKGTCKRSRIIRQRLCRKTCTGTGSDSKRFRHSFTKFTKLFTKKQYKSRCAYIKESGRCKHRHYRDRVCKKTCDHDGTKSKTTTKPPPRATKAIARKARARKAIGPEDCNLPISASFTEAERSECTQRFVENWKAVHAAMKKMEGGHVNHAGCIQQLGWMANAKAHKGSTNCVRGKCGNDRWGSPTACAHGKCVAPAHKAVIDAYYNAFKATFSGPVTYASSPGGFLCTMEQTLGTTKKPLLDLGWRKFPEFLSQEGRWQDNTGAST